MNKRIWLASLLAVTSPAPAEDGFIPPIVITATRTAETVDETLAAVTVITREELERWPSRSLVEVLRGTPGLTVTNAGGAGKVSAVFLRGTESDHVLVLVDGIEAGSATAAGIAWQDLPLEQIERIEVVRGPRSSLYGSEAIGGVIQIFTRRGGGPLRGSISLGAGSYETRSAAAQLSGGGERSWFSLGLSRYESDGFDSCVANLSAGCFADEPDADGYRRSAAQGRIGTRVGRGGEIELTALHSAGHTEFDGFYNANDFVEQTLGSRLVVSPAAGWRSSLLLGSNRSERDYFQNGTWMADIRTTRRQATWQNDLSLGDDHLLTLGLDYQLDQVDASTPYAVEERYNRAAFAQYQGEDGRHSLVLGLRRDDNQQFGGHRTGNAAWGYAWSQELRGYLSYGTAFKAPNFDDLYSPWGGNPDLDPEQARSLELGLQGRGGNSEWGLAAFRTEIDQLIALDSSFVPFNVDQARIRGLEFSLAAGWAGWRWNANLTWLEPENRSAGANHGKLLPRRSRRSLQLEANREFGAFSLGASVYAAGERYDDVANTVELSGYGLVDLRAGYSLARDWRLQAEVDNLFDKDYQTAAYYRQPGRNYLLTLRYAPEVD